MSIDDLLRLGGLAGRSADPSRSAPAPRGKRRGRARGGGVPRRVRRRWVPSPRRRQPRRRRRAFRRCAHELRSPSGRCYIDPGAKGADSPTLVAFEQETGIDVTYRENINDNAAFFGKLVPQMSAGQDPGYDLITLVGLGRRQDGSICGWLAPIDHTALPTVTANIGAAFADPAYDPGNAHSIPWQGGITGTAYDPARPGASSRRSTTFWDPAFAGHVGMLTEMVDTMNLTLMSPWGSDIQSATDDDVQRAKGSSSNSADAGIVAPVLRCRTTRARCPTVTCGRRWRGRATSSCSSSS